METKIVYVLTSSPDDIYLEQAYVSMASVRHYNPDIHIVLLTDKCTEKTFSDVRAAEIRYADEVVSINLDSALYDGQKRSRLLKTGARNLIDGDFLFVDCDTIFVRSLPDMDNFEADIAACRDTHCDFIDNPYRNMCLADGYKLGWPIDLEDTYFNSGVIYCKDNIKTREFYKKWNENLMAGWNVGVTMDQPSFAKTNYEFGHIVRELPDIWNCELKHGIRYLKDAVIVHYLCTNPSKNQEKQLFLLNEKEVFKQIKTSGTIGRNVTDLFDNPFCGLASLVHCFAGDDVKFFQTRIYDVVRRSYLPDNDRLLLYKIVKWYLKLDEFLRRIL